MFRKRKRSGVLDDERKSSFMKARQSTAGQLKIKQSNKKGNRQKVIGITTINIKDINIKARPSKH